MKSLIAVLALTLAVGAGYWKMQNPDGGLPEATTQANGVLSTTLSKARAGIDSIRSGRSEAQAALQNQIDEKLNTQATETESRLSALQQASTEKAGEMEQRLQALEEKLTTSTTDNQQQFSILSGAISDQSEDIQKELASSNESAATQLAEMQASLDQLSSEQSASVTNSFDAFRASLQSELDNLKAGDQNSSIALDTFTEKLASLDTRIDTLASAAAPASASSSENEAVVDVSLAPRLEAVTAQVDQRLAAMEERLAEATSADTRSSLDTLSADISNADTNLARLEKVIQQNNGRTTKMVGSAQTDLAKVSSDIELLNSEIETLKKISSDQADLAQINSDIELLKSDIEILKSAMESSAIENTQNDLREQLRNLENLVKSAPADSNSDITEISTALEKSRERILSLEQRVTDLPASSDSDNAKQLQEELQIQIAALETRLAKANATPDQQLVSTLSAVQQKVSELESKNYLTTDDIERLSETKSIQYKIYFDIGSTDISDDAAKVLDSLIAQEANRATNISIFGTTDRSGTEEYNQWLALRRANGVRSYLIQNGFDFTKIRDVDGIGEDLAASILPDGKNDPNQRSVIIFAFQP